MRKLTKLSIEALRNEMPVLDEMQSRDILGGCDVAGCVSEADFNIALYCGNWGGGFVCGMGYVSKEAVVTPSSYDPPPSGSYQYSTVADYNRSLSTSFWDSLASEGNPLPGSGMYNDYYSNQHNQCITNLIESGYNGPVYVKQIYSGSGMSGDFSTVIEVYNANTGVLIIRSTGDW